MSTRISRATLLKGLTGAAVAAVSGKLTFDWMQAPARFPCRMLGPSMSLGHMVRDGKLPRTNASVTRSASKVTIVGGGVAGLSAAWWLQKQGFSDFTLLEMEKEVGGNASSGKNDVSAYPWGAHYIPLANQESDYVRMLFEELGVIDGKDKSGLPTYNELYLCHDPQERLLKDGTFQEGLVPKRGLQKGEQDEVERFFREMYRFREVQGKDGKPAFAIPLDLSSQDEELLALDQISMADWLKLHNFCSRPLLWYVNYCCRDDYGSTPESVSAWAGIHYFAGRRGHASNAQTNSVVTWPEGNGFIIGRLKEKLKDHINSGCLVSAIVRDRNKTLTNYQQTKSNQPASIASDFVIFAAPRFLASHIIKDMRQQDPINAKDLVYAPWMVANISLRKIPDARGMTAAWDNVSYYSNSLGYVVATHQDITTRQGPTVITYYQPLSSQDPLVSRRELASTSTEKWCATIVDDLEKMHPGISHEILSMDLWPWGHGMIRPSVGFIWGETRRNMKQAAGAGSVIFAHSDMSGISNFEEAQYHGVQAAQRALEKVVTS